MWSMLLLEVRISLFFLLHICLIYFFFFCVCLFTPLFLCVFDLFLFLSNIHVLEIVILNKITETDRVKSPCSSLSPAMTSLQGFYGLTSPKTNSTDDNVETAQVSGPQPNGVHEDQSFSVSKFLGNIDASNDVEVIIAGDGGETNRPDGLNSVRRRPKADSSDSILYMSDLENMSESCSNDLRRMRNSVTGDSAAGINMLGTLRKSSSTSNLRGWESSSSFWPSSGAAAKPDGLPRPMNAWRSKDA